MKNLIVGIVYVVMVIAIVIPQAWATEPTRETITKDLKAIQYELNLVNTEYRKYLTLKNHYQAIADMAAKEIDSLKAKGSQLKRESDRLVAQFQAIGKAEVKAKTEAPKPIISNPPEPSEVGTMEE